MQKSTILVIADVAPIIFTLQQFLTDEGFSVVSTKSAENALSLLSGDPSIDIVICDLAIRGANGVELLRDARRITRMNDEGPLPPPKFIFMSAPASYASVAERQLRERATLMSDGHVVDKPIDRDDLLRRIYQLGGMSAKGNAEKVNLQGSLAFSQPFRDPSAPRALGDLEERQKLLDGEVYRLDSAHKELDKRVEQLHARVNSLEEGVVPSVMPGL